MTSYVNTPRMLRRFGIFKKDTGQYLTIRGVGEPLKDAEFRSRGMILSYGEQQWARTNWISWLRDNGYVRRNVTLPNEPVSYEILKPLPEVYIVAIDHHPVEVYEFTV